MKNIIALIVFALISTNVTSQIGLTKSEIIQKHKDYELEVANAGTEYISYVIEYENYDQQVACYLTEKEDNKEQVCFRVLIIEPSSETNNWIKYFNDNNFIKLDGMKWKDYENSILYQVTVKDGLCLVLKDYDTEL